MSLPCISLERHKEAMREREARRHVSIMKIILYLFERKVNKDIGCAETLQEKELTQTEQPVQQMLLPRVIVGNNYSSIVGNGSF